MGKVHAVAVSHPGSSLLRSPVQKAPWMVSMLAETLLAPLGCAAEADGYVCVGRCRQPSAGSIQAPACLCTPAPGWKACGCAPKSQAQRLPRR